MEEMRGKRVLVIGLGRSGVAAARYCTGVGAQVTVSDAKPEIALRRNVEALEGLPVEFSLGENHPTLPAKSDLIVISPGVPLDLPGLAEARAQGIPIIGELELAVQHAGAPIIAVTGTNGKTTTTALLGHLLTAAGMRVCVAGNIGTPLLDVLEEASAASFVILEISSFQIDTTPSLKPQIAVWLNVTEDHLDRHGSFGQYVASKARLLSQVPPEGCAVYNIADNVVAEASQKALCRRFPFDATGKILSATRGEGGRAWYGGGDLMVSVGGTSATRYNLAQAQIFGLHNRENMLAALSAAELAGAAPEALEQGLYSFTGLPHRIEFVLEHQGVRYYDDSKGTNVGATTRALQSFAEPIVLIAGGLGKGADFTPLAEVVRKKVKKLVLIGEAAGQMEQQLAGAAGTARAATMEKAVELAFRAAEPGDAVLLSPACASFDMFKDYADRGRAFVSAVEAVTGERKGG